MYPQLLVFSLFAACASFLFLYFFIHHSARSPAATQLFDREMVEPLAPEPIKMFSLLGGKTETKEDEQVEEYEPALLKIPYAAPPRTPYVRRLEEIDPGVVDGLLQNIAEHRDLKSSYYLVGLLYTTSTMNNSDISRMISEHPVLVDKIMKTANSSYYCLSERVEDIDRAVAIVGHDAIREMIIRDYLPARVVQQLHVKIDEYNRQWRHAIAVAVCARHLNAHVIPWDGGDIFSAAVFHDIGKLFFPLLDRTAGIVDEQERYGMNHPLVGGLLATDWKLPEIVGKCIAYHHTPQFLPPDSIPAPYLTPCFIICLADLICGVLGYGTTGNLLPIRDEYFAIHGLSNDLKDIVTPTMIREIDQACRKSFTRK